MKKIIILILFLTTHVYAQAAAIKKDPGAPTTIDWTFPVTSEVIITGFRVYVAPVATGPFTFSGNSTAANIRTITFPTTFSTNSVRLFFQIRSYKVAGTDTVESVGIPGDKEVELNVPSPTGILVR
jgi:hypothetical protein